jgi:hypothetical protein
VTGAEATELGVRKVEDIRNTMTEAQRSVANIVARMQTTSGACQVCREAGSGVCIDCYKETKERADGHVLTGEEIRIEQRTLPDGTQEVRLIVDRCDLQNRQLRRGVGWPTLRTEWENPAGQFFHWARLLPGEYTGPLTPPVAR